MDLVPRRHSHKNILLSRNSNMHRKLKKMQALLADYLFGIIQEHPYDPIRCGIQLFTKKEMDNLELTGVLRWGGLDFILKALSVQMGWHDFGRNKKYIGSYTNSWSATERLEIFEIDGLWLIPRCTRAKSDKKRKEEFDSISATKLALEALYAAQIQHCNREAKVVGHAVKLLPYPVAPYLMNKITNIIYKEIDTYIEDLANQWILYHCSIYGKHVSPDLCHVTLLTRTQEIYCPLDLDGEEELPQDLFVDFPIPTSISSDTGSSTSSDECNPELDAIGEMGIASVDVKKRKREADGDTFKVPLPKRRKI